MPAALGLGGVAAPLLICILPLDENMLNLFRVICLVPLVPLGDANETPPNGDDDKSDFSGEAAERGDDADFGVGGGRLPDGNRLIPVLLLWWLLLW